MRFEKLLLNVQEVMSWRFKKRDVIFCELITDYFSSEKTAVDYFHLCSSFPSLPYLLATDIQTILSRRASCQVV